MQKIIYANAVSETGDSANAASFDAYLAKSADEKEIGRASCRERV